MYFQVEEMEDRDSCTTEVMLNDNKTLMVLETNGPLFVSATGSWNLDEDGSFDMMLNRTYLSGRDSKTITDMGAFWYTTSRKFKGHMSKIGDKQGIGGSLYDVDSESNDRKVGFFEMIDTTVGENGEVSLRGVVRDS